LENIPAKGLTMKIYPSLLMSLLSLSCGLGRNAPAAKSSNYSIQPNNPYEQLDSITEEKAKMPPDPSREAIFLEKKRNATVFSVGIKAGALGTEAAASTQVKFAMNWESTLTLVRHTPNQEDQIVVTDGNGVSKLNYVESVAFVGSCSFKASATGSVNLVGSLKVFGNGVENTSEMESSLTTNAKSGFFNIKAEDNVNEIQARCQKVKDSVTEDLKALIANNSILAGKSQGQSSEQNAVKAALEGPEFKDANVYGHAWNVKPAQIEKNGAILRVTGQLSYRKQLATDNQIFYTIEITNGEVTSAKYDGAQGESDWEKAARKLADLIANEAFLAAN
jgi:hypothetical protein